MKKKAKHIKRSQKTHLPFTISLFSVARLQNNTRHMGKETTNDLKWMRCFCFQIGWLVGWYLSFMYVLFSQTFCVIIHLFLENNTFCSNGHMYHHTCIVPLFLCVCRSCLGIKNSEA